MNKQEKQVEQAQLNKEKQVLKDLKAMYQEAIDSIGEKVQLLQLDPLSQSKAYQAQFQQVMKSQIATFLDLLHDKEYDTIEEFLKDSYNNGFIGAMYSIQAQGIPLILPIAQEQVVKAIQIDSKIKEGLYKRLGNDIKDLKKVIRTEVARGISQNMGYSDIARNISNVSNTGLNNAMRIARTESHRVKNQAAYDAANDSQKAGADVLKQWDASLDGATRPSHRQVDGEIRELDEKFSNGLRYAGDPSGSAAEVINCRCATLTRARWALDEDELDTLKERAEYYGLDKSEQFEDYKKKYLKITSEDDNMELEEDVKHSEVYNELKKNLDKLGVEFRPATKHSKQPSEEDIIGMIAGADKTTGSCASLGLAYIGQKNGLNILDFRGGESQSFFSMKTNLDSIMKFVPEENVKKSVARSYITSGNKLLQQVEIGKEYYFYCGRHAAIVRKTSEGQLQYLELQSARNNGWQNFNGNPRYTLSTRFGCTQSAGRDVSGVMVDIEAFRGSVDLKALLGYINTAEDKQKKGVGGYAK